MAYSQNGTPVQGWIGVDLDGTLAHYENWGGPADIGEPVPKMLARVKSWVEQGVEVRIMTARASIEDPLALDRCLNAIRDWCMLHIGTELAVTNRKDLAMRELWDDRAVTVEVNTGEVITHPAGQWTP